MDTAVLSLEEEFSLPLVKEITADNARLRAILGTKLPDSQIEDLTIPHVFENKLLMKEGEFNGVYYPKEEILAEVEQANEKGLVYDHLDTSGQGASNWLGQVFNCNWNDSGPEGPGLYGDLKVSDKNCAQLLASGAKWGISPAIDYQKNEVGDQVIGTDLLWKSFSFVLSPAVRETMLNALKKEGDIMSTEDKKELARLEELQKAKKYPYKYPAQNQEDEVEKKKKKNKKIKDEEGELQVDVKTLDILKARDAEISELKEFKDKIELEEKTVAVANLVANEYLIGRLKLDELTDRESALMEKSTDVLKELADVIGNHADLSAYTAFVKAFMKKHKGATISQAAKAWKKKKPKGKGKGKLSETPTVDPAMPGAETPGKSTSATEDSTATDNPSDPEGSEELEEDTEELEEEGYINDPAKPAVPGAAEQAAALAAKNTGAAALTGADTTDPGRGLAELKKETGLGITDADRAMHEFLLNGGAR